MFKKIISRLPLIFILFIAALVRFYRIADYMTFLGDEGRDALIAYNILHGHFTLLGPTSSVGGFFLGPIYYYFMAPFLWLFKYHPMGPAVMVGVFGVFTVWFVYRLGKEFFNKPTGYIAAIIYSLSPVIISYSRSSWNPNIVPFFTIITLYLIYTYFKKKQKKYIFLSGICFGILMQLHYLATFVGIILFFYIICANVLLEIYKNKNKSIIKPGTHFYFAFFTDCLLILSGFLIGFSPFLAFEVRHGFPNIKSIFLFVFSSPEVNVSGNFFGTISNVFFRLFGRLITAFPPPEQVSLNANPNIALWYWLTIVLGVCSTIYFLLQFYKELKINNSLRQAKDQGNELRVEKFLQYLLIFLWFFIGIIIFGFYKKKIYDYYFGFLFPLPFLFTGFFLSFLLKNNILRILGILSVAAILVINILGVPFRFAPNRQYDQAETIAKFVTDKAGGKKYNFALITGGNSDFAYRYFFTLWGNPPVAIENPIKDPKRLSITDQLLVVCESLPCSPLGYSLWEIAGFGRAEIKNKWNVSVVEVYKLTHYAQK